MFISDTAKNTYWKMLKLINHETVGAGLKGATFNNTLYSLLSFFFRAYHSYSKCSIQGQAFIESGYKSSWVAGSSLTFTGEQHISLSTHNQVWSMYFSLAIIFPRVILPPIWNELRLQILNIWLIQYSLLHCLCNLWAMALKGSNPQICPVLHVSCRPDLYCRWKKYFLSNIKGSMRNRFNAS